MIQYIDEMYRDLARDLRSCHEQYPAESIDYKIMMQDLSGGHGQSIVPDIEFTDASIVQLRSILHTMPREHLRFFYHYYVDRGSRRRKMEALGIDKKQEFCQMRDRLHSYTEFRLNEDAYIKLNIQTKDRLSYPNEVKSKKVAAGG